MATTVLECLENAKRNFQTSRALPSVFDIAMEQLDNAINAMENGLAAHDVIQEHLFGTVNTNGSTGK